MALSMDFSGKAVSQTLNDEHYPIDDDAIFLSDIITALEDDPEKAPLYHQLDLSYSELSDADLCDVFTLVRKLPNCSVINLAGLSLSLDAVNYIQALVHLHYVRYVVICATPLASSLCWKAYNMFSNEDYEKLVFVDTPVSLKQGGWHSLIADANMRMRIEETHLRFFCECPHITEILTKRFDIFFHGQ